MWKVFKLYGSLVFDQIILHGLLVSRCVVGEERILSAKKREKFLSNLAKKRIEHSKLQRKRPFLFMPNRQNSDVSVEYW